VETKAVEFVAKEFDLMYLCEVEASPEDIRDAKERELVVNGPALGLLLNAALNARYILKLSHVPAIWKIHAARA
jgi:hypothetical protein